MFPIQPTYTDDKGVVRFRANKIVRYLLDHGGIDMNTIAQRQFPQDDQIQFAQLIGYSISGFSELSYVTDEAYAAAVAKHDAGKPDLEAQNEYLHETLQTVKAGLKDALSALYERHPDDFE